MRKLLVVLAGAVLVAGILGAERASAQQTSNDLRRSMGNLRPDHPTAAPAIQGSYRHRYQRGQVQVPVVPGPAYNAYRGPQYYPNYGQNYGYYAPNYGYNPYYGYSYPRYYRGPMYYPPVYIPAERIYGPGAVQRFMGVR